MSSFRISQMVAHFYTAAWRNRRFIAQYCHERRVIPRDHKEMTLQKCVCSLRAKMRVFFAVSNIVNRSLVVFFFSFLFLLEARMRELFSKNVVLKFFLI